MLRAAVWCVRVIGYVLIGLLTFLEPPAGHRGATAQTVAYALIGVGVAAWAVIDLGPAPERRHPRALAAALTLTAAAAGFGAAAAGGGTSLIAYAAVALIAAGTDLPLTPALTVGAVSLLAIEVGGVLFDQGIGTLVGLPLLLVVGLVTGRNRLAYRVQAEQSAALLEQYQQLRAEQRRADVLDERTRIAREIHDVLAHSLGALGIQIQAARALLSDGQDPQRALEVLATAQRMAGDGLVETRRAVQALRTDTRPLGEELAESAAEHRERHRVPVDCQVTGPPVALSPEATVALLRTAREALVNCAKHAPGQPVTITLVHRPERLRLSVANPVGPAAGGGAAAAPLSTADMGYGLTGMRERLLLAHGTLTAGRDSDGWTVTAEVPVGPNQGPSTRADTERPTR
ncbi:histidine kinase [Kitasatospora sp. NBC_01250]|uniref:sensor histidine kinase n=1 Tax=unclassified Kitasatospora TaxID=2633591 RepID=UPI002E133ED7|nr:MULTISPECIES: histidine kinase [unclassified Kitasatospora]WSJ65142.1 histidine kinase [Kitasatospora sp. NBC_01302]